MVALLLSLVLTGMIFLAINVAILRAILAASRRQQPPPQPDTKAAPEEEKPPNKVLDASDILGWEFSYIHATASEAMQDRHTMVNFYLLVTGILGSGLLVVLGRDANTQLPPQVGTVLLWLLCGVGWFYFLNLVRLRQAWYGSAQAMNQIKKFYIQHAKDFEPEVLRQAFLFQPETLPAPDKRWNVFFYSAMLIGFLDSVAFVAGGALLFWDATQLWPLVVLGVLSVFGLLFFFFHATMYSAFLRE